VKSDKFTWTGRTSRRNVLGGLAAGAAAATLANQYGVSAQDASPVASPAAMEFGCIGPAPTATFEAVAADVELKIALVPKLVHPFFEDCRIGGEEAATTLGNIDFQWVVPQTGDPGIQVQMIEDLVNAGVNAISISPNEATSVEPVIADAMSKGILVTTFDADSPASERLIYIGTDNKTAGSVQGETLAALIGGAGQVAIITGGTAAPNLNERIDGLTEALGAFPDIEIVETVASEEDFNRGLSISETLLRARPDLAGIACMSATGGPTLAQVIQGPEFADRIGVLQIVAFDDLQEVLDAIDGGIVQATMVQRPVQMGRLAVQWSNDILRGLAYPECTNVDTGVTVVTLDNRDSYTK
jgi:ribose transport system substrate-binding protein